MKNKFAISFAGYSILFIIDNSSLFSHLYFTFKHFLTTELNPDFRITIECSLKNRRLRPSTNVNSGDGFIKAPPLHQINYSELHYNLKLIISQLLVKKGLILLHAAGFIKDKKMCIMSAPSGTGKSTSCKIAAKNGYSVVCDDSVLIEVKLGKAFAYTTPFLETHKSISLPKVYEIHAIYFLHQSKKNSCIKMNLTASIKKILKNTLIFQNSMEDRYIKHYLNSAYKIAQSTSIFDLYFTKSSKFLKLL